MRSLIAALFALVLGSAQASAEERIALVIGNADYDRNGVIDMSQAAYDAAAAQHVAPDLANPINDARLIRDVLAGAGYDVTYGENLDQAHLQNMLWAFETRFIAAPADARVVVYYAGHALKYENSPRFLPVGASLPDSLPPGDPNVIGISDSVMIELNKFTLGLTPFLWNMPARAGGGFNLVIWDACRYNPWWKPGQRDGMISRISPFGDASFEEGTFLPYMPPTSVVVFSAMTEAQDGDGTNSPFAVALAQNLGRAGLRMSDMLGATRAALKNLTGGQQNMLVLREDTGILRRLTADQIRSYYGDYAHNRSYYGHEVLEGGIPPAVCVVSCPTP